MSNNKPTTPTASIPTIVTKRWLGLFFGKSLSWIRRNIFTNDILKEIGLSVKAYQSAKAFNLKHSKIIKKYLQKYHETEPN